MKDAAPFAVLREQASLDCLLCSVFLIGDSLVAICESLAGVTKEELIHVKLDKNEAFLVGPIELVLDYIILKVLNGKQRAANCVSFLQRCNVSSQYAGVASAHLHHVIQVSFVRVCVADNTLEPDGTRIQWALFGCPMPALVTTMGTVSSPAAAPQVAAPYLIFPVLAVPPLSAKLALQTEEEKSHPGDQEHNHTHRCTPAEVKTAPLPRFAAGPEELSCVQRVWTI